MTQSAQQAAAQAIVQDPTFTRKMRMLAGIEAVLAKEDDAQIEEALAVISSALCSLFMQTDDPQASYAQFLQDFAVTWIEGQKRMREGKR